MRLGVTRAALLCAVLLCAVIAASAIGGCASDSQSKETPHKAKKRVRLPERFGFDLVNFSGISPDELRRQVVHLRALGVRSVRGDVLWHPAQPTADSPIDLKGMDARVAVLARSRIRLRPIIDYSATWAATLPGQQLSLPRDVNAYARFARAVIERYGAHGSYWEDHPKAHKVVVRDVELWNEENWRAFSRPAVDPEAYADVAAAAAKAIHAAEPSARVVLGGLAMTGTTNLGMAPEEFLQRMAAARPDLLPEVSAVALHDYATDPRQVMSDVTAFESTLDAIGLGHAKVHLNEWGAKTDGKGALDEEARSAFMSETASMLAADCRVTYISPFAWLWLVPDGQQPPAEQSFSLATVEGPLPSAARLVATELRAHASNRC